MPIELSFQSPRKSITSLESVTLPDFTILTGENGSGKTHLLECIKNGNVISRVDGSLINCNDIFCFDWNTLRPNNEETLNSKAIIEELSMLWRELKKYLDNYKLQLEVYIKQKISESEFQNKSIDEIIQYAVDCEAKYDNESKILSDINMYMKELSSQLETDLANHNNINIRLLTPIIRDRYQKLLILLTKEKFDKYVPLNWAFVNLFEQSFNKLFVIYGKLKKDNEFAEFRAKNKFHDVDYLSDAEFIDTYGGEPWSFVNRILQQSGLGFQITIPDIYSDDPYTAKLIHPRSNLELKFSDLSSGEQIILSFALCLYHSTDKRQLLKLPKILLFDEIDASLHPSIVQTILNITQNIIVQENNIKVIMTTHSPTTVALSPDESIYTIENDSSSTKKINYIGQDKAISILTRGIPALSVNYDNRRQIFVESQYDVSFYEQLFDCSKQYLKSTIALNFINSGISKSHAGNCDHVKSIVDKLVYNGVKTAYGIIDWDKKNKKTNKIFVLAQDRRYSIENVILDPLALGCLCIRDCIIEKKECGLIDSEPYTDIRNFDNDRCQTIIDTIVRILVSTDINSTESVECRYSGGVTVRIPKEILEMQGHEYEKLIKSKFPKLQSYHKDDALKNAIIKYIYRDIPTIIPIEFIDIFNEIQNYDILHM